MIAFDCLREAPAVSVTRQISIYQKRAKNPKPATITPMHVHILIFTLLTLALPTIAAPLSLNELKNSPDFQSALTATGDHLPQLALPHLETLLKKDLTPEAEKEVLFLKAQTLLRDNQAQAALDLFLSPKLANHPGLQLWKAHALAATSQLDKALALLDDLIKSDPALRISASALQTRRGSFKEATKYLRPLFESSDPILQNEARIRNALLALAQNSDTLPLEKIAPQNPRQKQILTYLQIRDHLTKKEKQPALALILPLQQEKELPSALFETALILAHADALALDGGENEASDYLIAQLGSDEDSSDLLPPAFDRLRLWAPQITQDEVLKTLETWSEEKSPRAAYALHLLASANFGKAQADDPDHRLYLLTLLRLQHADDAPQLAALSLLESGRILLQKGDSETARHCFLSAANNPPDPETPLPSAIRVQALRLAARAADTSENAVAAKEILVQADALARDANDPALLQATTYDLALSIAQNENVEAFDQILSASTNAKLEKTLRLEKALALNARKQFAARELLEQFLIKNPKHPRAPEAALALAENCLYLEPRDRNLARYHIERLTPPSDPDEEIRYLLARLELNGKGERTRIFIEDNPTHPQTPLLRFKLAEMLEREKKYGEAHLEFEKLIVAFPDNPLANPARLLSARAALSIGTGSALDQALLRFDELANSKLAIAPSVKLEKIRALLDNDLADRALDELAPFLARKNLAPQDRWQALALSAEASSRPGKYADALAFYQTLEKEKLPRLWQNRIAFLTGRTLENLNRLPEALDAYYRVINREDESTDNENLEWHWYYRCAFEGALPLLEKAKSWRAAHAISLKLAEEKGPQSKRALEHAKELSLQHMLWEE